MYAVIQLGTSQYKVSEGDLIEVDRMDQKEGKSLMLDKVLMFAKGTDVRIGQPLLKDVKVTAKVVSSNSGKKVTTLKYRRCKNSATRSGQRPKLTALNIMKITA